MLSVDRFAELKPPFTAGQALAEASRCLFCHDAPCTRACPTRIDVPMFIRKIATGNLRGAACTILDANILGASCARVCPTEVLCEGACVVGEAHGRPVAIGRLQRHATDWVIDRNERLFAPSPSRGTRVAVVGAGPAGLACAAELARLGHGVTVFEASAQPGGLNATAIADYKLRAAAALREVEWVLGLGVELVLGAPVGPGGTLTFAELEARYQAIFLGVGLGRIADLGVAGAELPGVRDALELIAELKVDRAAAASRIGRRVAVIGGGNTAIDAATQSVRLGADEVTIVYRRGPEEMPAYRHEVELARKDGVRFLFQAAPVRVLGSDRVEGLEVVRTAPVSLAPDASGRRRYQPIPGSETTLAVDTVVVATGQVAREALFAEIPGLAMGGGRPIHDADTMQARNPRYFVGGDCASGGAEVVNAVAEGKRAAWGIHRLLGGDDVGAPARRV